MTDFSNPERMAAHLLAKRPDLASELVMAFEAPSGWRVRRGMGERVGDNMRSCSLLEAVGLEPSADARMRGQGLHLSAFGLGVRRELLQKAGTT